MPSQRILSNVMSGEPVTGVSWPQGIRKCHSYRQALVGPRRRRHADSGQPECLPECALGSMVEIQQTLPTYFTPTSLTCSRIDRVFTSTPGWILTLVCASASLLARPRQLHEEGVSDHAPVSPSLSLRRFLAAGPATDPKICHRKRPLQEKAR